MLNPPIYLGICFRAQFRGASWDLLGVGNRIVAPFLPQVLRDQALVLAVPHPSHARSVDILVYHENAPDVRVARTLQMDVNGPPADTPAISVPSFSRSSAPQPLRVTTNQPTPPGATITPFHLTAFPIPTLPVREPGAIIVACQEGGEVAPIGTFQILVAPPPAITEVEREDLVRRFGRTKAHQVRYQCHKCGNRLSVFVAVDPSNLPPTVDADAVPADRAPDSWRCACGSEIDLRFLKLGMHELLRHPNAADGVAVPSFVEAYQHNAVRRVADAYSRLISSAPGEEEVQRFLEEQMILWAFLSPVKVISKPCVLTKKKADFGVLSADKTLYLVEIEKPTTPLLTKEGGVHSKLQAGLNQLRDWRIVVQDHRAAFLDELGLGAGQVADIRYILIAGMASATSTTGLQIVRRSPLVDGEFYCFDDLGAFLEKLIACLRFL